MMIVIEYDEGIYNHHNQYQEEYLIVNYRESILEGWKDEMKERTGLKNLVVEVWKYEDRRG